MRIVEVTDSLHSHNGVKRVVLGILAYFALVTTLFGPKCPGSASLKGYFIDAKLWSKPDDYWMVGAKLNIVKQLREIREFLFKFDIMHLHTMSMITLLSELALVGRKIRPGIIFHVHTNYRTTIKGRYKNWFVRFFVRAVIGLLYWLHARLADKVIFPSKRTYDEIGSSMGLCGKHRDKVVFWEAPVVVDEACDRISWCDDTIGELPLDEEFLMYSGRIVEEKEIKQLFECFSGIRKASSRKINLALAGFGDISHYRKIVKELGVGCCVYFLGQLSEGEVTALASKATAAITYSPNETQGLAALKQMACGLLLIARKDTILSDFIERCNGGITLTGDSSDATTIAKFLADTATLGQYGRNAALFVKENFDPATQYHNLDEIYQQTYSGCNKQLH